MAKTSLQPPTDILGRERRFVTVSDLQYRADEEDEQKSSFSGHAAVFNKWANIAGLFLERIAPGAFKKTIKEADVRLLFNHNPDLVLARNKSKTLRLAEDDIGLLTEADLDRRQTYANDLAIAMERGDVDQMSFAFRIVKQEWEDADGDGTDLPKRTILEAQLYDVSPVTYPAYTETDASLRSAAFDTLAAHLKLDNDARTELLRTLADGGTPDLSSLRAAGEAPETNAAPEPGEAHSAATPVVDVDVARRNHRHLAATVGLTSAVE